MWTKADLILLPLTALVALLGGIAFGIMLGG